MYQVTAILIGAGLRGAKAYATYAKEYPANFVLKLWQNLMMYAENPLQKSMKFRMNFVLKITKKSWNDLSLQTVF